jgi:polysaccharide export outer membrane protein
MKKLIFVILSLAGLASLLAANDPAANANPGGGGPNVAAQAPGTADYVLAPSDLIEVQVYGEPDLLRDVRISRDDTIMLPLIGEVNLVGKTQRQAEEIIRDKYGSDYLVNPQVNLIVKDYSKRTVTVLGEVNRPGPVSFPLEQGLTLTDAIAASGGFTPLARTSTVQVTRILPSGEKQITTVNVDNLISQEAKGSKEKDFPLQINDIINVDKIFFIK